jgi:hypothetical protein
MPSSVNHDALQQAFARFDLSFSQAAMQAYLDEVCRRSGLRAVLDLLWEWESRVGYFNLDSLKQNRRYQFYDEGFAVTLRAQVNFARDKYSPQPAIVSKGAFEKFEPLAIPPLRGVSKIRSKLFTRSHGVFKDASCQQDTEQHAPSAPHGGTFQMPSNSPPVHCAICYENLEQPGKEKLRVFKFFLHAAREYFVQATPFPLFEKHFVVITREKLPMQMNGQSLADLTRVVELAPGYVGCSNSDVDWAGASILNHHHYQIFDRLDLPVMHAAAVSEFHAAHAELNYGLLHFPCACCKVTSRARALWLVACGNIIAAWKELEPGRNTCNLVVTKERGLYTCYILFRNPGFRTAEELLAIKSEGVGVIEVAGEGIYPAPSGEQAEAIWHRLEHEGLHVIKALIASNNPVPREKFGELFEVVTRAAQAAR